MKKFLSTLLILGALFSFSSSFAQDAKAYVKFSEEPTKKLIKGQVKQTDFFIEYKSKKEATIYLTLKKDGKLLGNVVKTIKSKKAKTEKVRINTFAKIVPGSGYYYELFMFEGPKNTWTNKIGPSIKIEDVTISRLN